MSIALRLALHLPRDAATVPMARRLLDQALRTLGVEPGCRDDIGLILTEACANVIEHALDTDDYEISIDITDVRCVIHVVNDGSVIDPARLILATEMTDRELAAMDLAVLDEHGRGLHIIRALADELYLTPATSGGLVLQAVTTLRWTSDAEIWQRR
ncbi:ATP-binding protein [Dactylosporangium aurantiacum]|uniref:ATP-binding protein n=1 Tax=Dactylosporangium aurantiacum TaxID=35754 RepID=A0A9Q9IAT3_9ACTN|nr:ATP-binding protein [Dactylosporangium aurantiacum]MDG6105126.1 ATP-binding protein [Dactylosporangium aurantiacum]UWZ51651.1 ATP-binding protein [Dactylosporangium aurantiacum]